MPTISRPLWRKGVAMVFMVTGFVLLYEATIHDSRTARQAAVHDPTSVPMAGSRLQFNATAYCTGTTTTSGVNVHTGIAAADPELLPVGSVVSVTARNTRYNGVYTIMDTGSLVGGRIVDLYMWSCDEARDFGRQEVQVTVLRLGWNPRASSPGIIGALFRRREQDKADGIATPTPRATPADIVLEPRSPSGGETTAPPQTPAPATGADTASPAPPPASPLN